MTDQLAPLNKRITELENELQALREENKQSSRIRHMWRDAVVNLKNARQTLIETKKELQRANFHLEENVTELESAKHYVEQLAYSDQQVINNVNEGIVVTEVDGSIVAVNPAFTRITGYSNDEVQNTKTSILKSGRHDQAFYDEMWQAVKDTGEWQGEIWNRKKDGNLYPELLSISTIRDWSGEPINYVGVFTDLSERKEMEQDLQNSRGQLDKLSLAVEHSPTAVVITDYQSRIEYTNPRFTLLTGYSAEEAQGCKLREFYSKSNPKEMLDDATKTLLSGQEWHGEIEIIRKDGSAYWEFDSISPIFDDDGKITHFVTIGEDITERKREAHLIWHQANYDALTELPNRSLFLDRLTQSLTLAQRYQHNGILMFIDLDGFKQVNDTLGHEAGDELLRQVAERLRAAIRSSDTVARLAGDEFTVILPEIASLAAPSMVAQKILSSLSTPFIINNSGASISGSIGIARFPEDSIDKSTLISMADSAMYRAKMAGRDTFRYYEKGEDDSPLVEVG